MLSAPKSSTLHYQLGRVYFVKNELDKAVKEFDTALALNQGADRAYYMRGLTYGYLGQWNQSASDFEKYITLAPTEWAGYNDLAWALYKNGDYAKAKEAAENGLTKFPDNAWLLAGAGATYQALGEYDKAKEYLDSASVKAEGLTEKEWASAYPGNDPSSAALALNKFRSNVSQNAELASVGLGSFRNDAFQPACASGVVKYCNSSQQCISSPPCWTSGDTAHCIKWNFNPRGGPIGCTQYETKTPTCDSFGPTCNGDADCGTPCTPDCSCANDTCIGSYCWNGCDSVCAGEKDCSTYSGGSWREVHP